MIRQHPERPIERRARNSRESWLEYDLQKAALQDLPPREYEQAVRRLADRLGV